MHWLVALLVAQSIGILAADAGAPDPTLVRVVAMALLVLAAWTLRARPRVAGACAVAAVAATSAAALATRLADGARHAPRAPIEATIEGTVASSARGAGGSDLLLRDVIGVDADAAPVPRRIRLRPGAPATAASALDDVLPGDRVRLRARLRPPQGPANPGGRDVARELARGGVGALAVLAHPALIVRLADRDGVRPLAPLHAFRARTARRIAAEGEGGALLAALALGDRSGLDATRRADFRQLGLTHLLSVSGLHLALAAAGVFAALGPIARRLTRGRDARRGALGAAALGAALYALLAGFEVPVQRSLAMLLALVAGVALRRPVRHAAPLALAAAAILAVDPAALFDAGAQMSFLASAALILAMRVTSVQRSWRERASDLFQTSALATAATAPVAAALGNVSPWGLLANALAVPWTGVALMPLSLAATLAASLGDDTRAGAAILRAAAAVALATLDAIGFVAAHLPGRFECAPGPAWRALALAGALASWRSPRLSLRVAVALAISVGLAWAPPARIAPLAPRLVALDVGQGDATLLQAGDAAVLVDGGTAVPGRADAGAATVLPALRALGVGRLDLVIASHADLDHRGGLASVLRGVEVGALWVPFGARRDAEFAGLLAVAAARGVAIVETGAGGAPWRAGALAVMPLWPPRTAPPAGNDGSLAVRVTAGRRRVLLLGDLEARGEAALLASGADLRADVVKLAHHGSRTSSSAALLAAAGGAVAIASAPRFGRFGMPHAEVLARCAAAGYALWWTGRDGAVLVSLGEPLWVRGWR